jgi:hypothetical protein
MSFKLNNGLCPDCDKPPEERGFDEDGDPCTHPCHDVPQRPTFESELAELNKEIEEKQ